jgi:hypothetical protein
VSLRPGIIARAGDLSEKVLEVGTADSKKHGAIGRKTTKAPENCQNVWKKPIDGSPHIEENPNGLES